MSFKIYTKTGDEGQTGLFGGPRVRKDDPRIEAYGTVDELNAALGVCRSMGTDAEIDALLAEIQHELFAVGAELASPDPDRQGTHWIGPRHIERLERAIDRFEAQLEPLKQFVLPAGGPAAAQLHLARTVCRRAERRVITLANLPHDPLAAAVAIREESPTVQIVTGRLGGGEVSLHLIVYLNRLGDLLFVLSRAANARAGVADQPWIKPI